MVHMMPYNQGFANIKRANNNCRITMANREVEKVLKIGNIPGTVINKEGVPVLMAIITKISYLPIRQFNLFSTTTMQQKVGCWVEMQTLCGWKKET